MQAQRNARQRSLPPAPPGRSGGSSGSTRRGSGSKSLLRGRGRIKASTATAAAAETHTEAKQSGLQLARELHAGVPDEELLEEADNTASEPTTARRSAADDEAHERLLFEQRRYDELVEETHRAVAQLGGPALKADQYDCIGSSLQEAKRFTDWWRESAPEYRTVQTCPLQERLIHERLHAWYDACLVRFPEIETMYIAERNVMERQRLEASLAAECPRVLCGRTEVGYTPKPGSHTRQRASTASI